MAFRKRRRGFKTKRSVRKGRGRRLKHYGSSRGGIRL